MSEVEGIYDELESIKTELYSKYPIDTKIKQQLNFAIDKSYWEEIIEENEIRIETRKFEQYEYHESMKNEQNQNESEDSRIERLFE